MQECTEIVCVRAPRFQTNKCALEVVLIVAGYARANLRPVTLRARVSFQNVSKFPRRGFRAHIK